MSWSGYSLAKWKSFLISRFFRLYPAFAAIALIEIFFYAYGGIMGYSYKFGEVTLLQLITNFTWTAAFFSQDWFVPVFWTLAIEAQFTFLILFVYPLLNHKNELVRVSFLLVLVMINYFVGRGETIFSYSAIFGMGMMVYLYYVKQLRLVLFIPLLIAAYLSYRLGVSSWHANVAFGTILIVAFIPQFHARWIKYLGRFAYSYFLIHITFGGSVLFHLRFFPDVWYYQALRVFIASLAAFCVSWIFYYKIEKPSHEYSRKFKS